MVVGPGHRLRDWVSRRSPAAGPTWKDPEVQAEGVDKGEKLFERFTWLGAFAALDPFLESIRCRFRPSCLHLLRQFYPAVFIVEIQSLLLCLFSCQVGEEVAHQGLFGFVPAQIVLCTLDHQVQTYQWVTQCLLQGL
jgi:hypothetical protein